jgi:hypothetical protein
MDTTPTKPKRREYSTIERTHFFDAYDEAIPITNFLKFCKQPNINVPHNTANKWLRQRRQIGQEAYRRTRNQSKKLGGPRLLNENDVHSLLDRKNPLHDLHYSKQATELGVSESTVRRSIKKHHPTARRYKKARTKHLSKANKDARVAYGREHEGETLRGFWRWVFFTDEAHFNSQELSQKPEWELRDAGIEARLKNLNEDVKAAFNVTLHVAAGCSYDSKGPLIFYNDPADPTAPKPYRPRAPRRSSVETAQEHESAVHSFKTTPGGPEIEVKPKGNAMSMKFYVNEVLPHHINHVQGLKRRYKRDILLQEDNDGSHGTRSASNIAK